MSNFEQQKTKFRTQAGFIAALDQSGGSTPKALKLYGIPESAYSGDAQMMDLIHAMRTRIITSPSFNGDRVLAAILFENTMDREILGRPTARVPVGGQEGRPDPEGGQGPRGRGQRRAADEAHARPRQAARARQGQGHLRHQDALGDQAGESRRHPGDRRPAVRRSAARSSPRASCRSSSPRWTSSARTRRAAEDLLKAAILRELDKLPEGQLVMLKLTIPTSDNLYADCITHPRVLKVVALSGGYSRAEANEKLARQKGMVASFSRALTEGPDGPAVGR